MAIQRILRCTFSWLITVGVVAACGGPAAEGPSPATGAPGEVVVKAPGDAKMGDTTRCPVNGAEFVVEKNSPKVDRDGATYFFCSESCKHKYDASPETFIAK